MTAGLLMGACGDSTGPGRSPAATILLGPTAAEIAVGDTLQLAATLLDASGAVLSGQSVTWRSSDVAVASVDAGGRVLGISPGNAQISATSGTASRSMDLTVVPGLCTAATTEGTLVPGQARDGELDGHDCQLPHGHYGEGWQFEPTSRTDVQIDLGSGEFDAFLLVTDPAMNVVALDDDGGDGLNSRLVHSFPAGRYVVWATSYGVGETGAYRLSMEAVTFASCDTPVGSVAIGQTVTGRLESSDCRLQDGSFADPWRLTAASSEDVVIDLTSAEFDTFLFVTDAAGNRLAWDDDGGQGFDSRLELTLAAGDYTVWAESYAPGATGAYRLSVTAAPPTLGGVVGSRAVSPETSTLSVADVLGADKDRLAALARRTGPAPEKPEKP